LPLRWPGLGDWNEAERTPIYVKELPQVVAFVKTFDNMAFYWILNAGHMVCNVRFEVQALLHSLDCKGFSDLHQMPFLHQTWILVGGIVAD
jgi:hypothetical protein